ncbi:MAG: haloacid dehalogenase-like hydrolase [Succinivibrionaceae bacterium]|nr:haloacid dehalogenase-like hydrolase [Succinivibrionaceae bacterium]
MASSLGRALCAAALSLSVCLCGCQGTAGGDAPRLEHFTAGSAAAADLEAHIAALCDPKSGKFVPEADRIAVFDLDGTLVGETYPSYFDWTMFTHRVLHDPSYHPTKEMVAFARKLEAAYAGTAPLPKDAEKIHARLSFETFAGMTPAELRAYARKFMGSKAEGFANLKRGDAVFQPMASLLGYLQAKGFTVFIVSGTERNIVRELVRGVLNVPEDRIIGSDGRLAAVAQGSRDGLDYVFQPGDRLVYTGDLTVKNVKMNKVPAIAREIGKVPVLAFGNSTGDLSMAQYVTDNPKYEGRAYLLLGDDPVREHGSAAKVEKLRKYCVEHGFHTISMKDDFATVYGEGVTLER